MEMKMFVFYFVCRSSSCFLTFPIFADEINVVQQQSWNPPTLDWRLAARGNTREKRKILAKRWDMKRPKCTPTIKKKSRWEKITTNKNLPFYPHLIVSFTLSLSALLCVLYIKNLFFLFYSEEEERKMPQQTRHPIRKQKKKFLFSLFFFVFSCF